LTFFVAGIEYAAGEAQSNRTIFGKMLGHSVICSFCHPKRRICWGRAPAGLPAAKIVENCAIVKVGSGAFRLNAIKAFEAAARLGSFTRAADELNVTHGAVSRQIRLLEDWLGVRLFLRTSRNAVPAPT
jgi:hypothetical protein